MSSVEEELLLLNKVAKDTAIARYIAIACTVALTWENLITFQREIELIWNANSSVGKWLYFAIRYPILVEYYIITTSFFVLNPTGSFCLGVTRMDLWCTWIFVLPVQIMIALRILALWDRHRVVRGILVLAIVASDGVLIMSIVRWSNSIVAVKDSPLAPIFGCFGSLTVGNASSTYPASAAYLAFDTAIFVLTLIRALPYLKECRAELLTVLIRDGFLYYSVMLASTSANLFLVLFDQSQIGLITGMRQVIRMLMSILVGRVILNARGAIRKHVFDYGHGDQARPITIDVSFSEPLTCSTMSGAEYPPELIDMPVRAQQTSTGEYAKDASEDSTLTGVAV